jgi:FKBP-type peptidyl-prolyl cis-trans isomerase
MLVAAGIGLAAFQWAAAAADEKPATAPGDAKSVFKDDREKASYALGSNVGTFIKRNNLDMDIDVLTAALRDVAAGKESKLTDQQAMEAMRNYQQEGARKLAEKNKKDGEAFLEENKKKEGVKTHPVSLIVGTNHITAELQYKVITEGTGPRPKSNDVVSVNYKGTLLNGKEFDSSTKHGGPLKRPANSLIRGWTEALQMMNVGSKWELFLPSVLAYGDRGGMGIDPGATLIFEMELLGIEGPPVAPAPQPLTSDIIKVPSAEELKKGAKIEVIKPEDAAKQAQQAQQTQGKPATTDKK